VLRVADVRFSKLTALLVRFGLSLELLDDDAPITGSYWGEPEAGVVGRRVYVRLDTPMHSLLHETCHVICMDEERRAGLDRDAGGDDIEEAAVCYLQILLADCLPGVGRDRLMQDMDAWGYSFRLGSSRAWFECDASDARDWLLRHGLVSAAGRPVFVLREMALESLKSIT
jgi:hypothetical protein